MNSTTMNPDRSLEDPSKPTFYPTRLIHHLTLTSLALTFFLSLILLVFSVKYADFIIHITNFSFQKYGLQLTFYVGTTPVFSLLASGAILILPNFTSRRLPPVILIVMSFLFVGGWLPTSYIWTSCELTLPASLPSVPTLSSSSKLPPYCPARSIQPGGGRVLWKGFVTTRIVISWMLCVSWSALVLCGWAGQRREQQTREQDGDWGDWGRRDDVEMEIRHWDRRPTPKL